VSLYFTKSLRLFAHIMYITDISFFTITGSYLCDAAFIEKQAVVDREYPEPCCSSGVAIRGQFCGSQYEQSGSFPCCANGEYVCAPNSGAEVRIGAFPNPNTVYPYKTDTFRSQSQVKNARALETQDAQPAPVEAVRPHGKPDPPPDGRLRVNITSALLDGTWVARAEDDLNGDSGDDDDVCVLSVCMDDVSGTINATPNSTNATVTKRESRKRCRVELVSGKRVTPTSNAIALAFENIDTGEVRVRTGYVRLLTTNASGEKTDATENENAVSIAIAWEPDSSDTDGLEAEEGAYAPVWVKM
jgi:hypothetical protein